MKPIRVLHLVPSFVGGGAERQLSYLALALAALGHEVHIGYLYDGPNLPRLQGTRVHLHQLKSRGNHDPRLLLRIHELMRNVRPDVVQTWLLQMDVFGGSAAKLAGVPWILSERCSAEMYSHGWKNGIRRMLGRTASAVIANSTAGLEYWSSSTNSEEHHVIRNIVPVEEIAGTCDKPSAQGALSHVEELIVAAGRLDEQKNWFVLFEALRAALNDCTTAHAVVFGEGPLESALKELRTSYECANRIHIRGYVSDLWRWMKRASVYVSVSRYEGTPNVVLEAIAAQCPIVLSDISSHREILSRDQAEFVALESPSDIAASLVRTLGDRDASKARAARAFDALSDWSGPRIASRYVELYRRMAKQVDTPSPLNS